MDLFQVWLSQKPKTRRDAVFLYSWLPEKDMWMCSVLIHDDEFPWRYTGTTAAFRHTALNTRKTAKKLAIASFLHDLQDCPTTGHPDIPNYTGVTRPWKPNRSDEEFDLEGHKISQRRVRVSKKRNRSQTQKQSVTIAQLDAELETYFGESCNGSQSEETREDSSSSPKRDGDDSSTSNTELEEGEIAM